ncbi:peptidyl-prolyl cis-trans isomerase [Caldalkalibacillus salinus]|uniref:peptidyl-prolyl cis-trans isomerase n=1 Tax=Caldalkalibacillus salinus TaxID=2803787 RepID=UPI001920B558|nr:peptidyl-prolyl cis-trans isomerase [Caldalkalibacillus salinus]
MKKIKVLWGIIFVLILLQVVTIGYIFNDATVEPTHASKDIVADINGETITMDELTERLLHDYGPTVLAEMIDRKLVFSEAERVGMTISDEELEREVTHLRSDYSSEEEFYATLQEQVGIGREELYEEIKYYLLLEELATNDVVVTEEEMRAYYEENTDAFYIPTRFHLHQIIVPTEQEAKTVIEEIEEGSSFEAVAAERSTDMITASDGGDMGIVSADAFYIPYDIVTVAEDIELETLSNPIAVDDGFAIIKVSERYEGGQQTFDEVKGAVRRELALQQIDGINVYLKSLRESAGVKKFLK